MTHSTPTADGLRFLTDDDEVRVVWQLKNGRPAHVLTREERARGGRVRAAKARERRASLRHARRGSVRLVEAAERLGEMLRSNNLESAMWADEVIKRHILPETSKHTSGLVGWYTPARHHERARRMSPPERLM
jgi:hypothetical protein